MLKSLCISYFIYLFLLIYLSPYCQMSISSYYHRIVFLVFHSSFLKLKTPDFFTSPFISSCYPTNALQTWHCCHIYSILYLKLLHPSYIPYSAVNTIIPLYMHLLFFSNKFSCLHVLLSTLAHFLTFVSL